MRGNVIKSVWNRLLLNITASRKSQLFEADPMIHQEHLLLRLLKSCENTMFGNMHGFSSIRSSQQFLTHVPLMSYSYLKPRIDKILEGKSDILFPGRPICFGVTTGTEGEPKLIPLNRALLRSTRLAAIDSALLGSLHHGSILWHRGKTLYVGPRKEQLVGKWMIFSEGTAFIYLQAKPLRARFVPKYEALPGPSEKNDYAFLGTCVSRYPIKSVAGNPLEIVDFVCTTQTVMPNVEIVINCGYWAVDHEHIYKKAFPNSTVIDIYGSNEGIWGLPVSFGRFLLNYRRIFFSFIPLGSESEVMSLEGVEAGRKYQLCVTTCGGLWNYPTGDIVCFEGLRPPLFVLCGRYRHILPLEGGWLTENEVVSAVRKAGTRSPKYYLSLETKECVLYLDGEMPEAEDVDRNLCQMNPAYKRLRALGELNPLIVRKTHIVSKVPTKPVRIKTKFGSKGGQYETYVPSDQNKHLS